MTDLEPLTPREVSILLCVWNGMSRKETAYALGLDESTVANRLYTMYSKWHVHNAVQLVRKALEHGILQLSFTEGTDVCTNNGSGDRGNTYRGGGHVLGHGGGTRAVPD